jgi:hypothetical protein
MTGTFEVQSSKFKVPSGAGRLPLSDSRVRTGTSALGSAAVTGALPVNEDLEHCHVAEAFAPM